MLGPKIRGMLVVMDQVEFREPRTKSGSMLVHSLQMRVELDPSCLHARAAESSVRGAALSYRLRVELQALILLRSGPHWRIDSGASQAGF